MFRLPLAPPRAVITNIVHGLDGSVTLYFVGGPNTTNIIQSTADQAGPGGWRDVSTNVADAGSAWQFTQTNLTTPRRVYRSYSH